MFRRVLLITMVALLAFGAGWLSRSLQKPAAPKWELADALPDFDRVPCVAPDERERQLLEFAASALNLDERISSLRIGAIKLLAHGIYRGEIGKSIPICPPYDIYARVSESKSLQNEIKYRLVEDELKFFSRLPQRHHSVIRAVGASAFSNQPQQSEIFRERDIRPYARTVLASFGKDAAPFSDAAYNDMSSNDSLGTGAAQVAAASGHPDALVRIQKMMNDLLSSIPADKALPRRIRNRLYELSYAIYFSGDGAKNQTDPIKTLMTRKVESWAPPFGMVELNPKRMCSLLERIEGPDSIKSYGFCLDRKIPLEQ